MAEPTRQQKKKKKIWVTAATADTVKLSVVKEVHANKPNGFVRCSVIRASARCAPPSRCSAALALKKNKKKKETASPTFHPSPKLNPVGCIWFSWGSNWYRNRSHSGIQTQKFHCRLQRVGTVVGVRGGFMTSKGCFAFDWWILTINQLLMKNLIDGIKISSN